MSDLENKLRKKIMILSDKAWDRRVAKNEVDDWLENFKSIEEDGGRERIHALYLLSNFMYFGHREIKELLKSLYRDFIKYPIVAEFRRSHGDTLDIDRIALAVEEKISNTRFLAVGNPSESGAHMLYYFRQENNLPKSIFINSSEAYSFGVEGEVKVTNEDVSRYIFIDDVCGGGTQALRYLKTPIQAIRRTGLPVSVEYFVLFGVEAGVSKIRETGLFDKCDAVYRLDDSFECFGINSRYDPSNRLAEIDWDFAKKMVEKYGKELYSLGPLGHSNCQLLLGLFHNTPNNSLPVFWSRGESSVTWQPVFRRYAKIYGEAPWR